MMEDSKRSQVEELASKIIKEKSRGKKVLLTKVARESGECRHTLAN